MTEIDKFILTSFKNALYTSTAQVLASEDLANPNYLFTLNSIDFVSLVVELEDALGIEFEESKLTNSSFSSLSNFLVYIRSLYNSGSEKYD